MIRITGNFTRILCRWMERWRLVDRDLETRLNLLADKDAISLEHWRSLLSRAQALRPDHPVGIEIGAEVQIQHTGMLGYLVLNSASLADALETYQLCEKHFYSVNLAQLKRSDSSWTVYWPHQPDINNPLFVQVALASLFSFMRQRFPESCRLVSVSFTGSAPKDLHAFETFFNCPVFFNAKHPSISFDGQKVHKANSTGFTGDFQVMRHQQLQAFTDVLKASDPFLQRLQFAILTAIPEGKASLPSIAKEMSCASRTLQRKLGQYGLSFQQLLDGVREQLAKRYLAKTSLSLAEIPLLLGFSDQSAFSRAFKHWSGMSPGEFRRREHW